MTKPVRTFLQKFTFVANASSIALLVYLAGYILIDPEGFEPHLAKDSPYGGGAMEELTWIVLLIGILPALFLMIRHYRAGKKLPDRWTYAWFTFWMLGSFYFAGEEVSWGQWLFGWDTPEFWEAFNYQEETNLHNTSSWLNQKPRAAVEAFIILCGFALPLYRLRTGKNIFHKEPLKTWEPWGIAPAALIGAGLLFLVSRLAGWLPLGIFAEHMGNSELREFVTAWFLMWYLLSFPVRLSAKAPHPPHTPEPVPAPNA